MSFILDALRKAESKNRTQHEISVPQGPEIVDDDIPNRPTDWPKTAVLAVGGLVLVGLGLLIGSAQHPEPQINPQPQTSVASIPVIPVVTEMTDSTAGGTIQLRETNTRALDAEARRGAPAPIVIAEPPTRTRVKPGTVTVMPGPEEQASSAAAIDNPRGGTVTVMSGRVQNESLPEYSSVLSSGKVVLPRLHLDMHVFSEQPEKRFVFINLTKYRQGAELDRDTTIEAIRTDGAVLNHKGFRFVLRPE